MILTRQSAIDFNKKADKALKNKGTIDFSEQCKSCIAILKKAKL